MSVRITLPAIAALMAVFAGAPAIGQENNPDIAPDKQGLAASAPNFDAVRPQAIAGMVQRYLVTEMRSTESMAGNVTTSIRITNMSGGTCSYGIEFYFSQGGPGTMLACTIQMADVGSFQTVFPCSRNMGSTLGTSCSPVCSPELTSNAGKAVIYSQNAAGCDLMAVNATIVNSSSDDSAIITMRTPKVVKYFTPSQPNRSNRGD